MTDERDNPKDLAAIPGETGSGLKQNPEEPGSRRDPEERPVEQHHQIREKTMDKTLADSFPTSDPPSSIPEASTDDPSDDTEKAA